MTNEEIQDEARFLITEHSKRFFEIRNPTNFELVNFPDEREVGFVIKIDVVGLSKGTIIYSPHSFVETLIRKREYQLQEAKSFSLGLFSYLKFYWERKIPTVIILFLSTIQDEFERAFIHQTVLTLSIFNEGTEMMSEFELPLLTQTLEAISKDRKTMVKRLVKAVERKELAPKQFFSPMYEKNKELWKKIKQCYTKVKSYNNPLAMVQAEYPQMPARFIKMLADPEKYVSMPSNIALLFTAHLLGVPKGLGSIRSLQDYLKESRSMNELNSEENYKQAWIKFIEDFNKKAEIASLLERDAENIRDLQKSFLETPQI